MGSTSTDPHVAVLAFPFATHAGLLFGLVKRLAAAAPDVNFSFFSTVKSNDSLFLDPATNSTFSNIVRCDMRDGVKDGHVFSGNPMEDIDLFLGVADDEFRRGVEKVVVDSGRKLTCLLADAFLWFSWDLAQEKCVPWVPLWTSGPCSLSPHIYTDLIRETLGLDGIKERMDEKLNFIPGFTDIQIGDLPGGVVIGKLDSPFYIMLHKMGQTLHQAAALPMNSFDELDPDLIKDFKSKFKKVLNVGPFNLTSPPPQSSHSDKYSCVSWLDNRPPKSVAYIAFGTVAALPPNETVALAEALEECSVPFLWSIKDSFKKHLPQGFEERTSELGKFVAWAPQVPILSHAAIGCFITHGGWNSVLESIAAGVPLICRPFFGDHSTNSYMVENVWKIGVRLNSGAFSKDGAMDALEQVLLKDKGKELREQITVYKELAFKAVGSDGSSTENFEVLLKVIRP